MWRKNALNAAKSPKFEALSRKSWSPRTIVAIDLPSHSIGWRDFCAWSLTHCDTLFWGITLFTLIVQSCKLLSDEEIRVSDFKYVGKIPPKHRSRDTWHAQCLQTHSQCYPMGNIRINSCWTKLFNWLNSVDIAVYTLTPKCTHTSSPTPSFPNWHKHIQTHTNCILQISHASRKHFLLWPV